MSYPNHQLWTSLLQTHTHTHTPLWITGIHIIQVRCPSCHPTDSVTVLKGTQALTPTKRNHPPLDCLILAWTSPVSSQKGCHILHAGCPMPLLLFLYKIHFKNQSNTHLWYNACSNGNNENKKKRQPHSRALMECRPPSKLASDCSALLDTVT